MAVEFKNEICVLLANIRTLLKQHNIKWFELRDGIAINYSDGCDAFYIRKNNPSILELLHHSNCSSPAENIFNEYQRLDLARTQVLIGIRHHAVQLQVALKQSASGKWELQSKSGCTSEIDVGVCLTRLLKKHHPIDAFLKLLENQILLKAPRKQAAERLINRSEPPEHEIQWKSNDETTIDLNLGAAWMAMDFSVLDEPNLEKQSPESLVDKLTRKRNEPGLKVIQTLFEKIGKDRFSVDISNRKWANFEFADGMDEYHLSPFKPRLKKIIQERGIDAANDYFYQEFIRLEQARRRVLEALDSLLAQAGYSKDNNRIDDKVWFGTTHRQYDFDPGRTLTHLLRKKSETEVLYKWFETKKPLGVTSTRDNIIAAIEHPVHKITIRSLPKDPPGKSPLKHINELDLDNCVKMADEIFTQFKQPGSRKISGHKDVFDFWKQSLFYQRGKDTWIDESWWIDIAHKRWDKDKYDQNAALVLLVNGIDEPREHILQHARQYECYYDEAFDDALIWFLRDELPWPIDEYGEYPNYPDVLGTPPPDLARIYASNIRQILIQLKTGRYNGKEKEACGEIISQASHLDPVSAHEWLPAKSIEFIHEACRNWARNTTDAAMFWEDNYYVTAARFGWQDVGRLLEDNPFFISAMLDCELSMLNIGTYSQHLSLIKPGHLAARFAAYSIGLNITDKAIEMTENNRHLWQPKNAKGQEELYHSIVNSYSQIFEEQRLAGAIAWHRCCQYL